MKYSVFLLAGMAALLGCKADTVLLPTASTVSVSGTISRSTIHAGNDTTTIRVTVKNLTPREVSIDAGCVKWFSVFRDSVELTPGASCSELAMAQIVRLAPRGSYTYPFVFSTGTGVNALPPGSYQIQPQVRLAEPFPVERFPVGGFLPLQILPK
jgi:hypothetical protein